MRGPKLREDLSTGYEPRFSTENIREQTGETVFHGYLQEACFVLAVPSWKLEPKRDPRRRVPKWDRADVIKTSLLRNSNQSSTLIQSVETNIYYEPSSISDVQPAEGADPRNSLAEL